MKERNKGNVIPSVVTSTTEYLLKDGLNCHGIFRRSANVQALMAVQKQIDDGELIDYASYNDPNLAAAVLKCFCRQLPKPLLTFDLYDYILQIQCKFTFVLQIKNYLCLMQLLSLRKISFLKFAEFYATNYPKITTKF